MKTLKRLAAALLLACLLAGSFSVTKAEAAIAKPTGVRFIKWNNSTCTSCTMRWNAVKGASAYQVWCGFGNGSHAVTGNVTSPGAVMKGLEHNHVNYFKVRALKKNSKGKVVSRSAWSASVALVPLPTTIKLKTSGSSYPIAKFSWNKITGSTGGYRVYMTTNPSGKWYAVSTTAKKSTANSAKITRFRGKRLQFRKNYYVRIATRHKVNGKIVETKLPGSYYYWRVYFYKTRR